MKKHLIIVFSIFVLSVVAVYAVKYYIKTSKAKPTELLSNGYPAPTGFRDLKWGDDLEHITGMEVVERGAKGDSAFLLCIRAADELMFDNVPLEYINYMFLDNKLVIVILEYKVNYHSEIMEALIIEYGNFYDDRTENTEFSALIRWAGADIYNVRVAVELNATENSVAFIPPQMGRLIFLSADIAQIAMDRKKTP